MNTHKDWLYNLNQAITLQCLHGANRHEYVVKTEQMDRMWQWFDALPLAEQQEVGVCVCVCVSL